MNIATKEYGKLARGWLVHLQQNVSSFCWTERIYIYPGLMRFFHVIHDQLYLYDDVYGRLYETYEGVYML